MERHVSRLLVAYAVVFAISISVAWLVKVPYDGTASSILGYWCDIRTGCTDPGIVNSGLLTFEQSISLSAFLFVVAVSIMLPKYRYFAAVLGLVLVLLTGTTPPQVLVENVEWRLIMFLIGSMTLAFILRRAGVFRYVAIKLIEASRGNSILLVVYVSALSWFLAMVVDEATSIIYVVMLILDIHKLTRHDVKPLLILSVIATNTGSLALPVGNPIGIYMAFTVELTVIDFLRKALPLSFISLAIALMTFIATQRKYLQTLGVSLRKEVMSKVVVVYYSNRPARAINLVKFGFIIQIGFLVTVVLNDHIAHLLGEISGVSVDHHHLLAFIPYVYIVVSIPLYRAEDLEEALEKGVEWSTLVFFISLFMLGYSLLWSGVAPKLAYAIVALSGVLDGLSTIPQLLLFFSAMLSSVLDNLSVIVAFTSVAKTLVASGLPTTLYWALLYGGVLGGNLTPIGSTANIIAMSMVEKKMKVSWTEWCLMASLITMLQIVIALLWLKLI